MPTSDEQGNLLPAEETGEQLENDQRDSIGDLLAFSEREDVEEDGDVDPREVAQGVERAEPRAADPRDNGREEYEDEEDEAEPGPPVVDEAEGEDDSLQSIVQAQAKQIERLTALVERQLGGGEEVGEAEPERPRVEIDPTELLSDEDWETFDEDPRGTISKLLAKVYSRAREDTINDIPSLVQNASQRSVQMQMALREFHKSYPELSASMQKDARVRTLIQQTANTISSEHPGWSAEQVFDATGKELGALLKLDKEADDIERKARKGSNQPSKPRSRGRGPKKDTRSGQKKEIDAMLDSLEIVNR